MLHFFLVSVRAICCSYQGQLPKEGERLFQKSQPLNTPDGYGKAIAPTQNSLFGVCSIVLPFFFFSVSLVTLNSTVNPQDKKWTDPNGSVTSMSMLGTLLLGLLRLKALILEAMIRKINLVMFLNYFSGEILDLSDLSYFVYISRNLLFPIYLIIPCFNSVF